MNPAILPHTISLNLSQLYGSNKALVDVATGREWDYKVLYLQAQKWKCFFASQSLTEGDVVVWVAKNSIDFFAALLAAKETSITLLPLNWRESQQVHKHIITLAEPSLILYEDQFESLVDSFQPVDRIKCFGIYEIDQVLVGDVASFTAKASHEQTPWYLLFTSGTTGEPKAVIYNWTMHVTNVDNVLSLVEVTDHEYNLSALPHYHTAGINLFAMPTLMQGGCVQVYAEANPSQLLNDMQNQPVTSVLFIPTLFQKMAELVEFEQAEFPVEQFNIVASGGAPISKELWQLWFEKGLVIQNGCGLTESGPTLFLQTKEEALKQPTAVGNVVKHTHVRLVGPDSSDVDEGEPGEILIKGEAVTPGYWRSANATKSSFYRGWFRTGDVAQRIESQYHIVDRMNDLFICGGECVYPSEIEQVINQLDAVDEVVVMGEPHRVWGETGVAIVVCKPGLFVTKDQVLDFCRENLARYKVPKRVEFADELPKTATGKIRRGLVRNWVA
ncbi:acyl--CoA ligase [Reinekea forsetii]|nr:acyl--CoA ligase [Reinekea forsetii]